MTDCRVLTFGRHALVEVMEHAGQVLGYMPPGTVHAVELLPDEQVVWFKLGPEIGDIQLGGPDSLPSLSAITTVPGFRCPWWRGKG